MAYNQWQTSYYAVYNGNPLYDFEYEFGSIFNYGTQDRTTQEIRLTSQGESKLDWMVGAFYEEVNDAWDYGAQIPNLQQTNAWQTFNVYACYYAAAGYDVDCPLQPTIKIYDQRYDNTVEQYAASASSPGTSRPTGASPAARAGSSSIASASRSTACPRASRRADEVPPLEAGEYYHHELIGLGVREETGAYLGVVTGILETGANDILVVTLENGAEALLPMIDEVVLNVDLKDGEVLVHLLPGLLLDQ